MTHAEALKLSMDTYGMTLCITQHIEIAERIIAFCGPPSLPYEDEEFVQF